MSDEQPLKFDLSTTQLLVEIAGEQYVLKELTGEGEAKFTNARFANAKFSPDGSISNWGNLSDSDALLVSLCLYDKNDKQVPVTTVRKWPARIVRSLYEKAREINEMDRDDETVAALEQRLARAKQKQAAAKNELSGSADGSD